MTPIKAAADPSVQELLALADQQSIARRRFHEDDADLIRESEIIEWALRRASAPAGNAGVREALHPATSDLVQRFAVALATKLRAAEVKYGYSTGWRDDAWQEECRAGLMKHVMKGDPLDVAAFAAFCWDRRWSTAPMYADHEAAFLPLFERWADAMLIGDPDREILRSDVRAALALPQPREALADEIKRADAAPPEASFDNASDMLGYLNAPAREVEPVAWMNREHVEAYMAGNPRGIAWASPEPTEFYDVALCVSLSPIPEAPTIDSTPSCGQENDYRRAQGSIPEAPGGREEIIAAAKAGYLKWLKSQHRVDSEALFNAIADEVCALKPQDGGESGS